MFSPYQLPHVIRFFNGIDTVVSGKLAGPAPAKESTLTFVFSELMDAERQNQYRLPLGIDALQDKINSKGDMLRVTLEMTSHEGKYETYVSNADFGLILKYENAVLPGQDWKAAYLIQAKRLYPNAKADGSNSYSIRSKFSAIDHDQDNRIQSVANILGGSAIKYCLYMPKTNQYDRNSGGAIRTWHLHNLSNNFFDYAGGLALHNTIRCAGGIDSGIWFADIDAKKRNAEDIHRSAFIKSYPLTWFILRHFNGGIPSHKDGHLNFVNNQRGRRSLSIAIGDEDESLQLINELMENDRRIRLEALPRIKVLPKYSLSIGVQQSDPDVRPDPSVQPDSSDGPDFP